MNKITTWKRIAVVILLLSFTVSCGQKGDLYLPEGSSLMGWVG